MASADHRSAAEIEREIEEERSALSRTLDEIHERLSFEALSSDFVGRVRDGSGDIGRTIARTARDHPIPVALTAIGLGWILAGHLSSSGEDDPYERAAARPASARRNRHRGRHASADPLPVVTRGEGRWDRARGAYSGAREAAAEAVDDAQEAARDGLRAGRDRLASAADRVGKDLRAGLESAGEAVEKGAAGIGHHVADAGEAIRRRAHGAYASAAELRHRITEGTEDLPATARKRVIEARTHAYEAQLRAERYAARQRERASDFFEEQPLVAGALALAVGAAIGGLLPRTRREDDAVGSYRDQVFDEADRIYRDERSRLGSVVRETAREAGDVAKDLARGIRDDVEQGAEQAGDIARAKLAETETKVRDAAEKVTDKARREAEKHGRG